MAASPKAVRCAVYTRKSTEHNLDLEFNSLDAQRESCEAYTHCRSCGPGYRPGAFAGLNGTFLVRVRTDQLGVYRPAQRDVLESLIQAVH
jgi:hypothetical protein